jgi:hypothetical protein
MSIGMLATSILAQAAPWQRLNTSVPPTNNAQAVFPNSYTLYRLEQDKILALLHKAGDNASQSVLVTLPTPDNKTRTFKVWETPVLPPELQAQHPDIRTYTAVATDDASVTAKLDYTMYGFRAMVYDGDNTYMIDPYSRVPDGYYMVYNKGNITIPGIEHQPCSVSEEAQASIIKGVEAKLGRPGRTAARSHGSLRRTYKAAITCTGEYAMLVTDGAPTTGAVLSIITSTINRCNGVFERELSITLQLIPNENEIIYLNPDTDPFTCNLNNDCLITQAQNHLDAALTGFTWDIGHIFNTAGGGLAAVGSTCTEARGSGVSGTGGPEDIGVILHEMGHQFGAPHTFNANSGGCEGNGSASTAYEPGSGSTIMSYAGICDPNNVASFSDEYYHVSSLYYITEHVDLGDGAACGTTIMAPAPVTVANANDTFYIPRNTPFELLATEASTVTGITPVITYCWEQYDVGNFAVNEDQADTFTVGPTFRSFAPTTSMRRTFPQMQYILDGSYATAGQRLSKVERTSTFRLTARSNDLGWGTFNYSDNRVTVITASQNNFRVTGPSTTALLEVGATQTITWTVANTTDTPIFCSLVNIQMSLDGGLTFPHVITAGAPNTGSYSFVVPDVYSDNVIFKVKGNGNIFFDVTHQPMKIHGNPSSVSNIDDENSLQVYPNPASSYINLRFEHSISQPMEITMFNILGQQVYSGSMMQEAKLDVANMARGTYYIHLKDARTGNIAVRKVVLQ